MRYLVFPEKLTGFGKRTVLRLRTGNVCRPLISVQAGDRIRMEDVCEIVIPVSEDDVYTSWHNDHIGVACPIASRVGKMTTVLTACRMWVTGRRFSERDGVAQMVKLFFTNRGCSVSPLFNSITCQTILHRNAS